MEHESMKTRLGGVTILRAGAALALVAALAACGGGSGTTAGVGGGQCAAGETLVGGDCLTAAQVTANTAITDARNAATALFGNIADPSQGDIEGLEAEIGTAETAIAGLPEDEREEADDLLDNARAVLASAKEVRAALDAPDPGNEQVADSGAAALAALRAYTAADEARKSAEAAHKLLGSGGTGVQTGNALGGTIALKGESEEGRKQAQAILAAADTLKAQETAVANAVKEIEAAIAALPAETPNHARVLESLNDDLRSAKRHQDQIDAIDLEGEVYRVRGASDDRKPSAFADYVASAVNDAFVTEGGPDGDSADYAAWWLTNYVLAIENDFVSHHGGGTDTLTSAQKTTIGNTGHITSTAPAGYKALDLDSQDRLPVGGMALSLFTDLGEGSNEDNAITGSDLTTIIGGGTPAPRDVLFKGLRANLRCSVAAGTGCTHENGALKGSWVLVEHADLSTPAVTPLRGITRPPATDLSNLFRLIDGVYREFGAGYVEYGYWLEGTDDDPRIVTFAVRNGWTGTGFSAATGLGTGSPLREVTDSEAGNLVQSATYEGKASGISVVETYGQRDRETRNTVTSRKSGHFTADVKLEADFAGTPELQGGITNFQGDAVGEGWRVELKPGNIDRTNGQVASGADPVTVGYIGTGNSRSGTDGRWNFNFVGGSATERPTDVYGGFGAYFPDGKAAGGYEASR